VLAVILYLNPLTYAANTIRDVTQGTFGTADLVSLGVLGALATVTFALAAYGFRTMEMGPIQ